MSGIPPYACRCCGYVNGDMYTDHFLALGRKPTQAEQFEYEVYRRAYNMVRSERLKAADALAKFNTTRVTGRRPYKTKKFVSVIDGKEKQ